MRSNCCLFPSVLFIFYVSSIQANPLYYNHIQVGGEDVSLESKNMGVVKLLNAQAEKTCSISNWKSDYQEGVGGLWLTSDKKAILLAGSDAYFLVSDLLSCKNGSIVLNKVPVPAKAPQGTVVDLNFDKGLYLSMILEDVSTLAYSAKISFFGSSDNILNYKGFAKKTMSNDDYFYLGDVVYGGAISPNGKYVAPTGLNCSNDALPGVWDLKEKKKVVFSSDTNSEDEIAGKCQKLFNGEATLKDLGGKMILPDK